MNRVKVFSAFDVCLLMRWGEARLAVRAIFLLLMYTPGWARPIDQLEGLLQTTEVNG